jgi:hypothetical protein
MTALAFTWRFKKLGVLAIGCFSFLFDFSLGFIASNGFAWFLFDTLSLAGE